MVSLLPCCLPFGKLGELQIYDFTLRCLDSEALRFLQHWGMFSWQSRSPHLRVDASIEGISAKYALVSFRSIIATRSRHIKSFTILFLHHRPQGFGNEKGCGYFNGVADEKRNHSHHQRLDECHTGNDAEPGDPAGIDDHSSRDQGC